MSTIDCLEILKNGLPEVDLPPRSIVIVGAGMAGLTAAMQPLIDIMEGEGGWKQLLEEYDDYSLIDYLVLPRRSRIW